MWAGIFENSDDDSSLVLRSYRCVLTSLREAHFHQAVFDVPCIIEEPLSEERRTEMRDRQSRPIKNSFCDPMIESAVAFGFPACRDLRHIDDVRNVRFTRGPREECSCFDESRSDGINKIGSGHPIESRPNRLKIEQIADYDFSTKVGKLSASFIILVDKGSDLISLLQQKLSNL